VGGGYLDESTLKETSIDRIRYTSMYMLYDVKYYVSIRNIQLLQSDSQAPHQAVIRAETSHLLITNVSKGHSIFRPLRFVSMVTHSVCYKWLMRLSGNERLAQRLRI
jgi:hypothetical protein